MAGRRLGARRRRQAVVLQGLWALRRGQCDRAARVLTGPRVAARRFVGRRSVNVVGFKLRDQLACWEAVQCDRLRQLLARVAAAAALPGVGLPTALDPKGGACT